MNRRSFLKAISVLGAALGLVRKAPAAPPPPVAARRPVRYLDLGGPAPTPDLPTCEYAILRCPGAEVAGLFARWVGFGVGQSHTRLLDPGEPDLIVRQWYRPEYKMRVGQVHGPAAVVDAFLARFSRIDDGPKSLEVQPYPDLPMVMSRFNEALAWDYVIPFRLLPAPTSPTEPLPASILNHVVLVAVGARTDSYGFSAVEGLEFLFLPAPTE